MFRMTVQDVFSIKGRGTVATGQVETGSVRVGDELSLGNGTTLKVDGIEAFRKILDEAHQGDNVGLLFKKLDSKAIARGMVFTGSGGGGGGATAASIGLEG